MGNVSANANLELHLAYMVLVITFSSPLSTPSASNSNGISCCKFSYYNAITFAYVMDDRKDEAKYLYGLISLNESLYTFYIILENGDKSNAFK